MVSEAHTWVLSEADLGLKPHHKTLFQLVFERSSRLKKEIEQLVRALGHEKYRHDVVITSVREFLENALEDIKEVTHSIADYRYRVQIGNATQNRVKNAILHLLQGSTPLLVRVSPVSAAGWPSEDDNITLEQLDCHERALKPHSKRPSYGVLVLILRQLRHALEVRNGLSHLHDRILDSICMYVYGIPQPKALSSQALGTEEGEREFVELWKNFTTAASDKESISADFTSSFKRFRIRLIKLKERLTRVSRNNVDIRSKIRAMQDASSLTKQIKAFMIMEALHHCPPDGFSMAGSHQLPGEADGVPGDSAQSTHTRSDPAVTNPPSASPRAKMASETARTILSALKAHLISTGVSNAAHCNSAESDHRSGGLGISSELTDFLSLNEQDRMDSSPTPATDVNSVLREEDDVQPPSTVGSLVASDRGGFQVPDSVESVDQLHGSESEIGLVVYCCSEFCCA